MAQELGSLLEFWGLKEGELNGEEILSASSILSCRRRVATTLPYPWSATSTDTAELNVTADYDENTVQRAHEKEQPEDHFLTRRTVPHTSEEAGTSEFCEYDDAKNKKNTSAISCVNCANYNVEGANWCIECGTAVAGTKSQPFLEQSLPKSHSNSTQFNIEHRKIHSMESSSQLTGNSNVLGEVFSIQRCSTQRHFVKIDSNHSRKKPAFSIKSPGQCRSCIQTSSGRCWGTSGLYMWRKPSSLKSLKPTLAGPGYQPNSSDLLHTRARNLASTSCTAMSPFLLCLPTELLLHILSYLSQSELATSMLVCHRIYAIASDPSLWNSVQISHKKNVKDDSFLQISRRKPNSLVLAHCYGSISSSCLQRMFCRMNTLQELTIDTCNFGPFTGDKLLISASIHCCQLSSVDIRWTQLSDKAFSVFSANCHSLRKIGVESVPQISINTFFLLMEKQRLRLAHVRIKGNMNFSVQDLVRKCESKGIVCPNVTYFSSNHKIAEQNLKMTFPLINTCDLSFEPTKMS